MFCLKTISYSHDWDQIWDEINWQRLCAADHLSKDFFLGMDMILVDIKKVEGRRHFEVKDDILRIGKHLQVLSLFVQEVHYWTGNHHYLKYSQKLSQLADQFVRPHKYYLFFLNKPRFVRPSTLENARVELEGIKQGLTVVEHYHAIQRAKQ